MPNATAQSHSVISIVYIVCCIVLNEYIPDNSYNNNRQISHSKDLFLYKLYLKFYLVCILVYWWEILC